MSLLKEAVQIFELFKPALKKTKCNIGNHSTMAYMMKDGPKTETALIEAINNILLKLLQSRR
jgi:hypothetical protein